MNHLFRSTNSVYALCGANRQGASGIVSIHYHKAEWDKVDCRRCLDYALLITQQCAEWLGWHQGAVATLLGGTIPVPNYHTAVNPSASAAPFPLLATPALGRPPAPPTPPVVAASPPSPPVVPPSPSPSKCLHSEVEVDRNRAGAFYCGKCLEWVIA